jgi:hypothetical protein
MIKEDRNLNNKIQIYWDINRMSNQLIIQVKQKKSQKKIHKIIIHKKFHLTVKIKIQINTIFHLNNNFAKEDFAIERKRKIKSKDIKELHKIEHLKIKPVINKEKKMKIP